MKLRTGIIALLFTLCLSGCYTTKSEVWKAQDVSLSNFEFFEILPVFNSTGRDIKQDSLSFFDYHLKEQFKVQNLQLADAKQKRNGILSVKNNLLLYQLRVVRNSTWVQPPGSVIDCKLLTSLIDKSTNNVVAKISTTYKIPTHISSGGPAAGVGSEDWKWVVKKSTALIAKEIAKLIQP